MTSDALSGSAAGDGLPSVWLSFDLVGGPFDPDVISARLGVAPSSQHRTGDPIHLGRGRRRHDRWRVTVGPKGTLEIGEMIDELRRRLQPATSALQEVCAEFGLRPLIICAVEPTSSKTPNILFPSAFVRWAAEIRCGISVDVMLWRDENASE
jgi:hypothetical protein